MKPQHILFIGIVGHAMRGLALAAKRRGHVVTGLDELAEEGPGTKWLADYDIEWSRTPEPSLLDDVELVIISGGTPADYPLIAEAKKRGMPVRSFAEYLGELTKDERVIAVSGTHGKTTTTSLIAWLLDSAARHPDFLVGVKPANFDSSARLDGSGVVVIEGDEYKSSSLDIRAKLEHYHPDVLVLTSIEHDHPDVYPDLQSMIDLYTRVVGNLPKTGRLVAWAESETVTRVAGGAPCEVVTYGLETGDFTAENVAYTPAGIELDVIRKGETLGRLVVGLYGRHNVLNALAAIAAALGEGLTFEEITRGARSFKGAYRRFNILTPEGNPITVVDDYAHHPTEVKTNIEAAKLHFPGQRLIAVFRPHTYSRTRALLAEYQNSFNLADLVFITDVESAREADHEKTVSGADILLGLDENATFEPDRAKLVDEIKAASRPGDVVLCMSVSGYNGLAGELADKLNG